MCAAPVGAALSYRRAPTIETLECVLCQWVRCYRWVPTMETRECVLRRCLRRCTIVGRR